MKKFWILPGVLAVSVFAVLFVTVSSSGKARKLLTSENAVANRYIVILDDSAVESSEFALQVESKAYQLAGNYGGRIDKVFSKALHGFSIEMSAREAEIMSNDKRVLYVEEDAEISISTSQPNATWGLDRIDQRSVPLNSSYSYQQTGAGVNVYVIDTGIRSSHADFGGRASVAFDALTDGQNGNDCNGHGTHVAGLVGSTTYGVAKNSTIHGVRVLPCSGQGLISDMISGVDWVTANRVNPAVANISITASGTSNAMDSAITNSIASGITFVVAAGNSGLDACNYSPARVPNAITTGATASTDQRPGYSNYGPCVDLFAPGHAVESIWNTSNTAIQILNGTSMASPHVAGTAALYLERNPLATPADVTNAIKVRGTPGLVTNVDSTSPNLLLYTEPFAPTAAMASVDGSVRTSSGRGIGKMRVSILNASTSEIRTAITNPFGYFRFENLEVGSIYVISVNGRRYQFETNSITFTLNEDLSGLSFIGF